MHQGARLLGRLHLPGEHGSDPLVRVLSLLLAFAVVAHTRIALSVLPSRFVLRIVRRLADLAPLGSWAGRPAPERIAWAICAVSRVVPRATCLTQAVAGKLLLRHYGFDSRLCLGVAKTSTGAFVAHAWIERERRILIGGAESAAFSPLPPLSATFRREPSPGAR
jgi:Transglutaminase-like superfamily